MSKKGSLTVEAVISFSVFIMAMFFLLTLVKLVLYMTILNNTATETAKTIAVGYYPLTYLDEKQTAIEKKAEYLTIDNMGNVLMNTKASGYVMSALGGDAKTFAKSGATTIVKNVVESLLVKVFSDEFYNMKDQIVQWICAKLVDSYLDSSGLAFQTENVVLRIAKVPETSAEYSYMWGDSVMYLSDDQTLYATPSSNTTGLDGDFNAGDVVICIEYPYTISLPFIPSFSITLRSTAIEHAWLNSTASGPKRTEGINIEKLLSNKTVYIATGGYGKKYHTKDCWTIKGHSKAINLTEAQASGYTACKVCRPDDVSKK